MIRTRHRALLALTLVGTLLLSACGGSDKDNSTGTKGTADVAAAKALIQPYLDVPSKFPVEEPLEKSPAGKKVAFMDTGTPTSALIYQLMDPAAKAVGMDLKRINTGQSADSVTSAFDSVVSGGFDGVVVASVAPSLWKRGLDNLLAKKIPIVTTGVTGMSESDVPVRLASEKSSEFNGELLAAYLVAKHGSDVDAVFYQTPEITFEPLQAKAFQKKLKELCPTCKSRVADIPAAKLGSTAPSLVTSDLQAHPKTTAAVFAVGEMANGLSSAMKVAGLKTEIISGPPTPETLQQVKDGGIKAVIGFDLAILGWTAVDSMARQLGGQAPAAGAVADQIPIQFLTKENLPDDVSRGWSAYPDFADKFMALWKPALS